jgi:hypothetical protein
VAQVANAAAPGRTARRRALVTAGVVVLVALGIAASVVRARGIEYGTDFHARRLAGLRFWSGEPLYVFEAGVSENTYPPFAAMVFQVFAPFPLRVAAGLFYFANLALIPAAFLLTRRILRRAWPGAAGWWPLVLAGACSAEYFLSNLNAIHPNTALFVLVLLGIAWYQEGRDVPAAAAFVGATAIKLIPVFFVFWVVVRGRTRAALAVVPLALAALLLPIAQRGPARGLQDLRDYHAALLGGLSHGRVIQEYKNHNLAAAVYRLTRPPQQPHERDYRIATLSEGAAQGLYRAGAIAVGGLFAGSLLWLRRRAEPVSVFEWCGAFLTGHLLSAMTWRGHLPTLLFVLAAFFAIPWRTLPSLARGAWWVVAALAAVAGLTGRDLVGPDLHYAISGSGVLTALQLGLFAWSIVLLHRARRPWEAARIPTAPHPRLA